MAKPKKIEGMHFVAVLESSEYKLYFRSDKPVHVPAPLPGVQLGGDVHAAECAVAVADRAYRHGVETVLRILRSRTSGFKELDSLEASIAEPVSPPKWITV